MKPWKYFIIKQFEKRNIYISRKNHPNDFLIRKRIETELIKQSQGVIHIGAHIGQEASFYNDLNKSVVWIEASPETYKILTENIVKYHNQRSILALLGDQDRDDVRFNLADNSGASSSIYEIDSNSSVPFKLIDRISLPMKRLDTIIFPAEMNSLNHWVVDVQGAELQVLKGSGELIKYCNSLIIETKKISYYKSGTTWNEIMTFLDNHGFINLWEVEEDAEDNVFFVRVKNRVS